MVYRCAQGVNDPEPADDDQLGPSAAEVRGTAPRGKPRDCVRCGREFQPTQRHWLLCDRCANNAGRHSPSNYDDFHIGPPGRP